MELGNSGSRDSFSQGSPRVSVVMPAYNTERFLSQAVESVLRQTYRDFEFIIVDDGSTDGTWQVLESYALTDPRMRLLRNERNSGIAYSRALLLSHAKGEFVAVMDSDDVSVPSRLAEQVAYLDARPEVWALSGHNDIIDEGSRIIGHRRYALEPRKVILRKSPLSHPFSIFRRMEYFKIGGYDPGLDLGEDYDLWVRIVAAGGGLAVLDGTVGSLRIRGGQTKSSKLKRTLLVTLKVQWRAVIRYGLRPSAIDLLFWCAEVFLFFLPNSLVFLAFRLVEYRNRPPSIEGRGTATRENQ